MTKKSFFILALAFTLLLSSISPVCVLADEAPNEVEDTLLAVVSSSGQDSLAGWAETLTFGDEWYVIALSKYNTKIDLSAYGRAALRYVKEASLSAVERQRVALALIAAGFGDETYVAGTPDETIAQGGVMSVIFGLHLANNGIVGKMSADDIIDLLLDMRTDDGGWTVRGTAADVDVTAMAVTALAPNVGSSADVDAAVEKAVLLLSSRQNDDGGFSSYGVENAESASQVMIALVSLGRDPYKDADFIKNGKSVPDAIDPYRLPDGTYCHVLGGGANGYATVQALMALIAQGLPAGGGEPLLIFKDRRGEPSGTDTPPTENASDETAPKSEESEATANEKKGGGFPIRAIAASAVVIAAVVIVTFAAVRGKRRFSDIAVIVVIAALIVVLILFVNIQSPDEYFSVTGNEETAGVVTISADCSAVRENGVLIAEITVGIKDGDTVFDVITEAARRAGVLLDFDASGTYLRGIGGVSEFDYGDLSGWKYSVNGVYPPVSCAEYTVSENDIIVWEYVTEPDSSLAGF